MKQESNDNRNLQQLELEALNAIFPSSDEFVCKEDSSTGLFSGNLQINIALSEKTMLRYPAFQTVENLDLVANDAEPAQDDTLTQDVQVHHLPPISLHFTLPPLYPTLEPPELNLECFWLSFDLRNSLREKFLSMWEDDRGEILFRYCDFTQNELPDHLNLFATNALSNTIIDLTQIWTKSEATSISSKEIFQLGTKLVEYDAKKSESIFNASSFTCSICFEKKLGADCLRVLRCHHIFCRACLLDCFSLFIKEGSVEMVMCPDPGCKKNRAREDKQASDDKDLFRVQRWTPLLPSQFISLVGSEAYNRYLKLVEAKTYEGRNDVIYCPRPHCETPIVRTNSEDKLGLCPKCRFAFCVLCSRSWHGYHTYCQVSNILELVEKYMNAPPNEKQVLELRYGKKQLEKYAEQVLAERETLEYLRENTASCPTCQTKVEKSMGCNHMTCTLCLTHFCYICEAYLDRNSPYKHYSDTRSNCYGRLFEDPGEVDEWGEF